jgi:hypothetical protein
VVIHNTIGDGIGVGSSREHLEEPFALLPLKPDENAARDTAVRSLCRAAIATGLSAVDRGIRSKKFAEKTWPQDGDVALILRGSVAANAMAVSDLQAAPSR